MENSQIKEQLIEFCSGIPDKLPDHPGLDESVPHAPKRVHNLSDNEKILAVKNALRYFKPDFHQILKSEFENELEEYGHIYMYRFRPKFQIKGNYYIPQNSTYL